MENIPAEREKERGGREMGGTQFRTREIGDQRRNGEVKVRKKKMKNEGRENCVQGSGTISKSLEWKRR